MKTIEMEIAIMEYFGVRQNLIVPNISWGIANLHECDIIVLSRAGYTTEIEIKVSKNDLLKDKEKPHNHRHDHIAMLFFAVPKSLQEIALEVIPERAGLFVLEKYRYRVPGFDDVYKFDTNIIMARQCERNKNAVKWSEQERYQLARLGTMRILALKKKINQ